MAQYTHTHTHTHTQDNLQNNYVNRIAGQFGESHNLKNKSKRKVIESSVSISLIICVLVGIVFAVVTGAREKTNTKIATMQEEVVPKAISEVVAKTPDVNSGTFHYEESLEIGTNGELIKVPVPTGYVGKCVADESYVNGVTTEGVREHSGGFVIYEKKPGENDEQARSAILGNLEMSRYERNQWVWIPISEDEFVNLYSLLPNGMLTGKDYNFTSNGYSLTNFTREPALAKDTDEDEILPRMLQGYRALTLLADLREQYYEMLSSIATYGGFYIGRYETSIESGKMVVRKMKYPLDRETWFKMYKASRSARGTTPIDTSLIWGIQWDETLKWLIDSGEKTASEIAVDSVSWGNFKNANFEHTTWDGSTTRKNPRGLL